MEMQQVRYFLALSSTLNFTRAAEECNITQPALTRAIKNLEDELGGELIRRERQHSHLTELGRRMLPLLQQCYDAAVSAKSLAKAVHGNEIVPMNVAVANCVNMAVLAPLFAQLARACPGVELQIRRGTGSAVAAALRNGEADVAIAGPLDDWDRLDEWPLFREPVELAFHADHRLGGWNGSHVALSELEGETMMHRVECETMNDLKPHLPAAPSALRVVHEVETDHDLVALLEVNAGVAFLSATAPASPATRRLKLLELDLWRTIAVYCVAGRLRTAAAATFLNLLRAADWSPLGVSEPA